MGKLRYDGTSEPIDIDDVMLAHLKVVIGTKLRRQESFMMSWHSVDGEHERATIWIHPAIPLQFFFESAAHPHIVKHVVEELMVRLNATGELDIDEHAELHRAGHDAH